MNLMISAIRYLLLFSLASSSAYAELNCFSWIHPTNRECSKWNEADECIYEAPLTVDEIDSYILYFEDPISGLIDHKTITKPWGLRDGNPYICVWESKPRPHCYRLTTVTGEQESLFSAKFCKNTAAKTPAIICQ